MSLHRLSSICVILAVGSACQDGSAPILQPSGGGEGIGLHQGHPNGDLHAFGAGHYAFLGTTATFRMDVTQEPGGVARGHFHQSLTFQEQLIWFDGIVTCLAVDYDEGRLWVGGVVTRNRSEHPLVTTDIHQPGKDIWFRVLDTGTDSEDPDRTTFMGFEGGGGIITSAEYCEAQIWPGPPDDVENARTNPFIRGGLQVK